MEEQDYKTIARSRLTDRHRSDDTFLAILDTAIEIKDLRQTQYLELGSKFLDIDQSTGKNLDVIGNLIGESRTLVNFINRPYFGYQGARLAESFDVGYWYSLYKNKYGTLHVLNDEEYRRVLKARVLKNCSKSSRNSLVSVLNTLTGNTSTTIVEQEDNKAIQISLQDDDGLVSYYLSKYKNDRNLIPVPLGRRIELTFKQELTFTNVSYVYPTMLIEPNTNNWSYKSVSNTVQTNYLNVDKTSWSTGKLPFGDKEFLLPADYDFPVDPLTIVPQQQIVWAETNVLIQELPQDVTVKFFVDNGLTLWVNGIECISNYDPNAHYFESKIPLTNFVIGTNRITIKVADDILAVRPDNWIWFDMKMNNPSTDIHLSWDVEGEFVRFEIYRNTQPTDKSNLTSPIGTTTSREFLDTTTDLNMDYYYTIVAITKSKDVYSEEIYVSTVTDSYLTSPENLTAIFSELYRPENLTLEFTNV